MRRRHVILYGCVLALLAVAGILFLPSRAPNLAVQGKRMGDWALEFNIWEWPPRTPAAMTLVENAALAEPALRAFGLLASHDGANSSFQRAFREFRLYGYEDASRRFELIYAEHVSVPYGQGLFCGGLCNFRNLAAPVNGQRFRLEVVQNGTGPWHGPRLIELYGFDQPVTGRFARETISNQEPLFLQNLAPKVANASGD